MAREDDEEWRNELIQGLGRPLLLIFWCFILWGTLYGFMLVGAVLDEGVTTALARATSGRNRMAGVANVTLAFATALVWLVVGGVIWRSRRKQRGHSSGPNGRRTWRSRRE